MDNALKEVGVTIGIGGGAEEVRHASRNADSACPFLPSRQYKNGHAESAFHDACREVVWLVKKVDGIGGCGHLSGGTRDSRNLAK